MNKTEDKTVKEGKLSRTKLRQAARLAIAIHGYDLMQGFMPKDVGLSDEEYEVMTQEAHRITSQMAGNHPMNMGSVNEVLQYFKSKIYGSKGR
jgi:hypothetical protein